MTYRIRRNLAATLLLFASGCSSEDDPGAPAYKDVNDIDATFLDRSADPCRDFYQFACGTWVKEHPVDEFPAWDRFSEGRRRNRLLLRRILEGEAPVTVAPEVAGFYQSCLVAASAPPSRALDEKLALIANMKSMADLPGVLAALQRAGVWALFAAWPYPDPGEPSRRVPNVFAAGLTLPGRDYYVDPEFDVRAEFETHIAQLFRIYSPQNALDATGIADLETRLATALPDDSEPADPRSWYHLLSFGELLAAAPSFAWSTYFEALGAGSVGDVDVNNLDYLAALEHEFASTPLGVMQSYLAFRTLESHGLSLGPEIAAEEGRFHGGVFWGDPTPRDPRTICLDDTLQTFAADLAKPFVAYRSTPDDRALVTEMANDLVDALRTSLDQSTWLDAASRDAARAKLDAMLLQIGFPDDADWPVSTVPAVSGSYLATRIDWYGRVNARAWAAAKGPVNRGDWSTAITETNAWYSSQLNRVLVPAGILELPHFDATRRSVLNYGALGSVVGHEITHGFDNNGRWFDGEGRLRDWWSEGSAAAYGERTACLVNEYDAFEVKPGLMVDGQATLGENIADLGGLKLAYAAYHASGARDGASAGFSVDQQFFLSYAQMQCANFTDELATDLTLTDSHALPRFRVNGVVQNVPEFAQAFACPADAPLAPAKRCSIF